jgi:hypothetical protein
VRDIALESKMIRPLPKPVVIDDNLADT